MNRFVWDPEDIEIVELKNNHLFVFGGKGSGNFGHAGRPGQVGGSSKSGKVDRFGQPYGVHTREGQKKIIQYLERETREKFKPFGSLAKDKEESENDMDIALIVPSEPTTQSEFDAQLAEYYDSLKKIDRDLEEGRITQDEYMKIMTGEDDPQLSLKMAMGRIGYKPVRIMGFTGAIVYRFNNQKTQHSIDIWTPGDPSDTYQDMFEYDLDENGNIIQNSFSLFHQGGKGSGNWGHQGRPGQVGGSAPKGYTEMDVDLENLPQPPQYEPPEELTLDELFSFKVPSLEDIKDKMDRQQKRVREASDRLGYGGPIIPHEEKGQFFTVGNNQYITLANYDHESDGTIHVYDIDNISDSELEGILAHEIQHSRWSRFKDANEQETEIIQESFNGPQSRRLIKPGGDLANPNDSPRFSSYLLMREIANEKLPTLIREDGVTEYSKSYWDLAEKTKEYDRAIDETLAEIARLELSEDEFVISDTWFDLYRRIQAYG